MTNININIRFNPKIISALLLVSVIGFFGFKHNPTKASTTALTGQCGMLFTRSFFGFETAQNGQSGQVHNSLVYIDFDAGTGQLANATISNFGLINATAAIGNSIQSGTFTQSAGPVTGSYTLTMNNGVTINVLPVNSGNTFLIQLPGNGTSMSPATGVCQRI